MVPQFYIPETSNTKRVNRMAVCAFRYCREWSSTRSVDELVKALDLSGDSEKPSPTSVQGIDNQAQTAVNRPIAGDWPSVSIDATA